MSKKQIRGKCKNNNNEDKDNKQNRSSLEMLPTQHFDSLLIFFPFKADLPSEPPRASLDAIAFIELLQECLDKRDFFVDNGWTKVKQMVSKKRFIQMEINI